MSDQISVSDLPLELVQRLKDAFIGENFDTDETVMTRLLRRSILSTEQAIVIGEVQQHLRQVAAR